MKVRLQLVAVILGVLVTALGAPPSTAAAAPASEPSPAAKARELGGVSVALYCSRRHPGSKPAFKDLTPGPYDWICIRWIGRTAYRFQVDMNLACRYQYGSGAYARLKYNSAYGWRCYR